MSNQPANLESLPFREPHPDPSSVQDFPVWAKRFVEADPHRLNELRQLAGIDSPVPLPKYQHNATRIIVVASRFGLRDLPPCPVGIITYVELWNIAKKCIDRAEQQQPAAETRRNLDELNALESGLHETLRKLAAEIMQKPGQTAKELAKTLGCTEEHVRRLFSEKLKRLRYSNAGGGAGYFPPVAP